jgi:glycosyltransferase involved in cell wall biosynthesis
MIIAPILGIGGTEKSLSKLLNSLENEKIDICCILIGKKTSTVSKFFDVSKRQNLIIHEVNISRPIVTLRKIHMEVRNFKPNIIEGYLTLGNLLAIFFGSKKRISICNIRSVKKSFFQNPRSWFAYSLIERMADSIIVNAPHLQSNRQKISIKTALIPSLTSDQGEFIHKIFSMESSDEIYVLTIANLRREKDLENFINQIDSLPAEFTQKLHFHIVGEGEEREKLEEKIQSSLFNIKLEGFQRDIRPFLQKANIYIHPSRTEGMPNAAIEAILAGIPFLLSKKSYAFDLVSDLNLLYDIDHVGGLSHQLVQKLTDMDSFHKDSERERKKLELIYSQLNINKNRLNLYHDLIQN